MAKVLQRYYGFMIKCKRPDRKEFLVMVQACIIGFSITGFAGCFTKLLVIFINNILHLWLKNRVPQKGRSL
jgi:protein translocase SEC61 complex gamma subunit